MKNTKYLKLLLSFIFITLLGCSSDKDPITGERKNVEPNPQKKAREYADKQGGLFNSSRLNKSTTYDFATSNPMWRATLKSLGDIPLANVDYSGGVVLTDWYNPNTEFSSESIKIQIRFISTDVAISSIQVSSYKKICNNVGACKISSLNNDFNDQIKEKIIVQARSLKIEDEKKKK